MDRETKDFLDANEFRRATLTAQIYNLRICQDQEQIFITYHDNWKGYTGFLLIFDELDEESPERYVEIGDSIARVCCLYFGLTRRVLKRTATIDT